jgi:YjbE family integral membrane protein
MQFLWALGAIVLIDLVLAGDNAIVIALAARNLPKHLQKKAIVWGSVGAILVRAAMTGAVVWLLRIPGLLLVGGALLLWIAVKLLKPADDGGADGHSGSTGFWGAMKTIVIADAVMGLDNVLAVAGAAHGSFLLVVLGLLISIPIVVWGSTLILEWVERYPAIMVAGAAVLAWTAVKMMLGEPLLKAFVEPYSAYLWIVHLLVVGGVIGIGAFFNGKARGAMPLALSQVPAAAHDDRPPASRRRAAGRSRGRR